MGAKGSNASYFLIALCSAGRADYLFAQAPDDPDPVLAEGSYTVTTPTILSLHFDPTPSPFSAEQVEYDATSDRLVRIGAADGYSPTGIELDRAGLTWVTPRLSCE